MNERTPIEIVHNPARTEARIDALTAVWEASVGATHDFLTPNDIESLRPFVKESLWAVRDLLVACAGGTPVAFLGMQCHKIEMLFLHPSRIGTGLGGLLITQAIHTYHACYVDVNEQNPKAVAFYRHYGFCVIERTAFDEQGNRFPILKMKRT